MKTANNPEMLTSLRELNKRLEQAVLQEKNTAVVDLFPSFLDEQGKPKAELYVEDGTHFSSKGQAILTTLIKQKL